MHLLDTDTLTRAHAGSPRIAERVRQGIGIESSGSNARSLHGLHALHARCPDELVQAPARNESNRKLPFLPIQSDPVCPRLSDHRWRAARPGRTLSRPSDLAL